MPDILILYYSRGGSVAKLAAVIARGVEEGGGTARLRTVPPVAPVTSVAAPPVPESGAPYVEARDLVECAGLLVGSPTRFGLMAAPMKFFFDGLGAEWASGTLAGKPAGVFTSTGTLCARPLSSMKIIWRVFSRWTCSEAARLPRPAFLPIASALVAPM